MANLKKIADALRENDKKLNEAFAERASLTKDLTQEEKNKLHDVLWSDGQSHWDLN